MNTIAKQSEGVPGTSQDKFYTWKGVIPVDMLQFIDKINTALDLPPLAEEQVMLLAKFIIYEFTTLTIQEVEVAIFKAKAGKFPGCNSADYNKLGIDFIGRVLNAYSEWKQQNNISNNLLKVEDVKQLPYTTEEGKLAYKSIKEAYDNDKEVFIANWNSAFQYMEEEGILNQTDEEKNKFKDEVISQIQVDILYTKSHRKNYDDLVKIIEQPNLLKHECRKRIIKLHFESK